MPHLHSGAFQHALAEALRPPDQYFTDFLDALRFRRDLLVRGLREARPEASRPADTYVVTADTTSLGDRDGLAFCRSLFRFAFCKRADVVQRPAHG